MGVVYTIGRRFAVRIPWAIIDINAWIAKANRGRSVRDVVSESQHVFQQLLAGVEGLPDDVHIETLHHEGREYYFVQLGEQRIQAGEFFDHFHHDHESDIRAWLAQEENRA